MQISIYECNVSEYNSKTWKRRDNALPLGYLDVEPTPTEIFDNLKMSGIYRHVFDLRPTTGDYVYAEFSHSNRLYTYKGIITVDSGITHKKAEKQFYARLGLIEEVQITLHD